MKNEIGAPCRQNFEAFARIILRSSLGDFYKNSPYTRPILFYLEDLLKSNNTNLIINMPPRHLKTTLCTVCVAAWQLGKNPSAKVIIATYNESLAKDIVGEIRKMMKSSTYRQIFATRIQKGQDRSLEFATTAGGWLYGATMAGSGVTGRGADLIIVDDPLAANDADDPAKLARPVAYFENELRPRFNNPSREKILCVQHRLGKNDFTAYLLDQEDWQRLALPLIAGEDCVYPVRKGTWLRKKDNVLRADEFPARAIKRLRNQSNFEFCINRAKVRKPGIAYKQR